MEVPEGLSASEAMAVLVEMIRTPEATDASLSRRLQSRGLDLKAPDVRKVVGFYGLEKKGGACAWRRR